jgi:hypothetical protein
MKRRVKCLEANQVKQRVTVSHSSYTGNERDIDLVNDQQPFRDLK